MNVPKSAPIRTLNKKSVTLHKKYRIRLKTYYFISLSVCLCWLVWISQVVCIYLYCPIIFVNKCQWFAFSGLWHRLLLGIFKKVLILVPSPKMKPKFENYFSMLSHQLGKSLYVLNDGVLSCPSLSPVKFNSTWDLWKPVPRCIL